MPPAELAQYRERNRESARRNRLRRKESGLERLAASSALAEANDGLRREADRLRVTRAALLLRLA